LEGYRLACIMEKILFIIPMSTSFEDFVNPPEYSGTIKKENGLFGNVLTEMPLGSLAMSSYIKKHIEIETKLVDFNTILNKIKRFEHASFEDLFKEILSSDEVKEFNPTIIGVSALFSPAYLHLINISKICKELFPNSYILAGGGVPTNLYKEIYNDGGEFDALCYGEGEIPLLNFVLAEDKLKYVDGDSSWVTKEKIERGEKEFTKVIIEDLNEIPMYDYSLCTVDDYSINPTISAYVDEKDVNKSFAVMTSRGCPFKCCFCASHSVHGRTMRYYDIERVRQDFTTLKEHFNAKTLIFQDDHFLQEPSRAIEVLDIVKDLGFTVIFQNGLAIHKLKRPILEALYDAGIRQVVLPVESGSQRVLTDIMHKPLKLSMVPEVIKDCKELGIYVDVNILIGLPGEKKEDIEDSFSFLKTLDANWFSIMVATPLVGSEMMDICMEKNYLKTSYLEAHYKNAVIETEDFDSQYILDNRYILNLSLNFRYNPDMRLGNYETALSGFENTIRARPDHAIAYYYASICSDKLGNKEKADSYRKEVKKIIKENIIWAKYLKMFDITI